MLHELFVDVLGANVTIEELDICSLRLTQLLPKVGAYDGFILPGSPASVAAGSYAREAPPEWLKPLELLVRQFSAKQKPMIGICFGHQIMATALGGRVEKNAMHGLQAAACSFETTALGAAEFLGPGTTSKVVELLYHHGDVTALCKRVQPGTIPRHTHATARARRYSCSCVAFVCVADRNTPADVRGQLGLQRGEPCARGGLFRVTHCSPVSHSARQHRREAPAVRLHFSGPPRVLHPDWTGVPGLPHARVGCAKPRRAVARGASCNS